jgi:N-acetylmuramoyl-L-alanine amidase
MRIKGAIVQQWMLGAALILALCWNIARASEIKDLALTEGATGTRAELLLDTPGRYSTISLAGPDRLVVDLPASTLSHRFHAPTGAGVVKSVRTGQPVPGTVRIVFDLAQPVAALKPRLETGADGTRLVLEWPGDGKAVAARDNDNDPIATIAAQANVPPASTVRTPAIAESTQDAAAKSADATSRLVASLPAATKGMSPNSNAYAMPANAMSTASMTPTSVPPTNVSTTSALTATTTPTTLPPQPNTIAHATPPGATKSMQQLMRGGVRPLVIAIDAGHGGQDPGARGANGSREKDLTLAVARELARQVNATPGLKAYLTRDTDVFIPLAQRYQKARAAKADLFVSIHADAFTNPDASGSSVFVLSQRGASSQAARWLANQENAADLVGGVRLQDKDNTLASVLLDLSQTGTMKASEDIAGHVLTGLKKLGKTHKGAVERANFVVLRSPDVPSMLVETAFISNPGEERKLNDASHRSDLARAILDGVNTYFERQPPPGTLYAARAEAAEVASTAAGGR